MLYGINSRERDKAGFIAEKNRYAPWNGAPMQGRMDCTVSGRDLTLIRDTRRTASPMGQFTACYTGTQEPVPDLTGQNCGEQLLGVPRQVFERSAFIRQAGLGITPDAELERRIVSLITTGEEDTSYTEAESALKKQLNQRRHNRTGRIPAAEAELAEVQRQQRSLQEQQDALRETERQIEALQAARQEIQRRLQYRKNYDAAQQVRQLRQAQETAAQAEQALLSQKQQLSDDRIPESDTIIRLRGAIVNLETTRKNVEKARADRDEAMKALLRAEKAVQDSPFAGQTPENAKRSLETQPDPRLPGSATLREVALSFLFFALAAAGCALTVARFGALLTGWTKILPWCIFGVVAIAGLCVSRLYRRHAVSALRQAALVKRFGTADPSAISALADSYAALCEVRDRAQADANGKSATADTLYNTLTNNEQGILLEVRRFAPTAFDIPAADQLLREAAVRRKKLQEVQLAAEKARMRSDLLAQQLSPGADAAEGGEMAPPTESLDTLNRALEQAQSRLSAAQSQADRLSGQIAATGDPAVLSAQAEQLTRQLRQWNAEYYAIALAMDVLQEANTTLQNRFSPELGRRSAEIFRELTAGRYSGVVLDRSFHLSAEPAGDPVYRDAQLLSAGASDQLYLAVRMAVCEMVLPAEKQVPIILDDALASFDDARCAAALRWLQNAAKQRQVLLFTCHHREAALLADAPGVWIQQLTNPTPQV